MKKLPLVIGLIFLVLISLFIYKKQKQKALAEKRRKEKARQELLKKKAKKPTQIAILIAKTDIKTNTFITKAMLTKKMVPVKEVPVGAITKEKEAIGKFVMQDILKGEPIRKQRLFDAKLAKKLADKIPKGMRAIAITVNKLSGVGGFLRQGDRVDVIGTFPAKYVGTRLTKTVLQNIEVLAIGKDFLLAPPSNIQSGKSKKKSKKKKKKGPPPGLTKAKYVKLIVVAATPEQAEKLILAGKEASLMLALRGTTDLKKVKTKGETGYTLLGKKYVGLRKEEVSRRYMIQIVDGSVTKITFVK